MFATDLFQHKPAFSSFVTLTMGHPTGTQIYILRYPQGYPQDTGGLSLFARTFPV